MFNVIIQPFHLLIYTVLVGSAMTLVTSNMIYGVVAIGFIIPAEKLLRKFFGFDNAGTLSAAGSFAGGAVFSALISKLNKPKSGKGGGSGDDEDRDKTPRIRKGNVAGTNGMIDPEAVIAGTSGTGTAGTAQGRTVAGGNTQTQGTSRTSTTPANPASATGTTQNQSGNGGQNQTGQSEQQAGVGNQNTLEWMTAPALHRIGEGGLKDRWNLLHKEGKPNIGQRLYNAAGSAKDRAVARTIKGVKRLPRQAGRFVRRTAVGAAGALPLAFMGAAVGAASGDPSKAFQLAAAGGTAGYYGLNYYGDKVARTAGNYARDMKQGAKDAFWGTEKKKLEQAAFDKAFTTNVDNIDALTKALGSRQKAKEAMSNGDVQAFLNNGITDTGKIGRALVLMEKLQKGESLDGNTVDPKKALDRRAALERSVSVAALNKSAGRGVYESNSYARRAFKENFAQTIMEQSKNAGVNISQSEAEKRVEEVLAEMQFMD